MRSGSPSSNAGSRRGTRGGRSTPTRGLTSAERTSAGADLSGADLRGADLNGADLSRAWLVGAHLRRADLSRANLSEASLRGALLDHTVFSDTDLASTKGLDSCIHDGPSTIDDRTLAKSGELPPAFLRGAGVLNEPREGAGAPVETTHSSVTVPAAVNYKLFIAARRLDMFFGILPASHLSLVVREENGTEYEYEGHPEQPSFGAYGRIVVTKRFYRPRPDRQSVRFPLPWDRPASDAIAILDADVERLNAAAVPYNLLGPNSNTVARTLLLALGLEPLQPTAVAPGFEHEAL